MYVLSEKHKNIGVIAALIKNINEHTGNNELPAILVNLFVSESEGCDHKTSEGYCLYSSNIQECTLEFCPLGDIVEPEVLDMTNSLKHVKGNGNG